MGTVSFLTAVILITLAGCVQVYHAQNVTYDTQTTICGQNVVIPTDGHYDQITVNLTFDQPQPSGASCSWVINARNPTTSSQVMLTYPDGVSCEDNVFTVVERNTSSGASTPLILECLSTEGIGYKAVVNQPGFQMVISLGTVLPLKQSFTLLYIFPVVWTDVCPGNNQRIVLAPPESEDEKNMLNPTSGLVSSLPHNMVCRWEITSPDQGLVKLQLRSFLADTSQKVCSDHFVISDEENSPNSVTVRLCAGERLQYDYTSTTGSAFITFQSGSSEVSPTWYMNYWYVNSCPPLQPTLAAVRDEVQVLKGTSFSSLGAGQGQQCGWKITTGRLRVIKLTQLDAPEFQQSCNSVTDYLTLNGQRVGMCDGSKFPIWSEDNSMEVSLHTNTQVARRSFLLHYTAVYKTPCQGHPVRRNITGFRYFGEKIRVQPIPQGDETNGPVCQWLYTAADQDKVIQVTMDWAATGSNNEDDGVDFDRDSCSYSRFRIYSDDSANSTAEITPTCAKDRSNIVYTSHSRSMLFVYTRDSSEANTGFLMDVNQIVDPTSAACVGKDVLVKGWGVLLVGLVALLLLE